jgi:mRNA interferase YafQ
MKTLSRHKTFIKDMRNVRLTDTQATKLFLYIACLLKNEPLPPESRNHYLQGEWSDFQELHLGGDLLLIYQTDDDYVYLTRLGSHAQLFKKMSGQCLNSFSGVALILKNSGKPAYLAAEKRQIRLDQSGYHRS